MATAKKIRVMTTIKDLTDDQLQALYMTNKWFNEQVNNEAWESMSMAQSEEASLIGCNRAFDIDSTSYTWWYKTPRKYGARDGYSVARQLDAEYMSDKARKIYEELNELARKYDQAYESEELTDELEDAIDDKADELAEQLTADLKQHEDAIQDYIQSELDFIKDGERYLSELELTEDGKHIKEVIIH